MQELEPFRKFLIEQLAEVKDLGSKAPERVKPVFEGQRRLLEQQIVFITKSQQTGELDMEKAKAEIKVVDEGIVEELGRASREKGPVTIRILELAEELGRAAKKDPHHTHFREVDPRGINRKAFEQKVWNLRGKMGGIPEDIKPVKKIRVNGEWKEGLFLVKLNEKQMSAEPRRTRKSKED